MVSKVIIRDQVREHLLEQMTQGQLEPGKTLNLAALARKLDVSVTPIREALTQLQQSKLIKAIPNRGFIIADLNYSEAKDLYELVADLEVLALEHSDFDEASIVLLKQIQIKFKEAKDTLSRIP